MSDKQDFSEIGDRIKDAVQDAVNSGDFGQLNHVINDSVNGALDEVRWQVNQAHERVYKRTDKTVEYKSASAVSLLPTAHRSRPTDDRWSRSSVIRRQSSISARTARSFIRTRSTCRRFL